MVGSHIICQKRLRSIEFAGIWDCLTSQQVVDFIRYQVAEGKDLTEIGEMMCEHCLAPDTSSGAGIGCDNMTILIVALLHGRTKEEWYAWVKDRVQNGYGYKTPSTVPQLYAQSRLAAFRARRSEAQAARDRRAQQETDDSGGFLSSSVGSFARVLGSTGGISFQPGGSIMSDSGNLMFAQDDSDDDDSGEEEMNGSRTFFSETLGLGRAESPDPGKALKARLEEFEQDMKDEDAMDADGTPDAPNSSSTATGEAPPPPQALPNGDAKKPVSPVEQLKSLPGGDEASPVVQKEGLMDTSEDPTKV